jgi:oxygen-independent coproporphyrinogen-3 oxidase
MLADEYILLRLRTSDGIDLSRLQNEYGVDLFYEKEDEIDRLISEGFIEVPENDRLRLTDDGKLLCDSITSKLLLEAKG